MKFSIESMLLTTVLQDLAKAVPAKPALPILSNFLFELNQGLVRITASDGEIALRGVVKPDESDDKGRTTIPAKILLELMRTLPGGPVTLEQKADSVQVRWGTGDSVLPVFDAEDYIKIAVPEKDKAKSFSTTTDILTKAIAKTVFAVGTDEVRPALCGIFFDIRPTTSYIVASDARKLVVHALETPEVTEESSFILPTKAATILKGILPKEQPVTIVSDGSNARFAFGSTELTTRLVVGKYPNYRTIIPTTNSNVLTASRETLLNVLRRMAVFADKQATLVKAKISFNLLTMTAEDLGLGVRGAEKAECDYDGNDILIGLNASVVTDVLSTISASEVEIRLSDERHAILIQPAPDERKDEPYEAVVMPYNLNK